MTIQNVYSQDIVINEIQTKNLDTYRGILDNRGNVLKYFEDWIEIKNTTTSAINLSGYFLSDNSTNLEKWVFPENSIIPASGFLVVNAVGDEYISNSNIDDKYNANFKLSANDGELILSTPTKEIISSLSYGYIPFNLAFGRLNDGKYSLLSKPTPGANNRISSSFKFIDADITTSLNTGLYATGQSVSISNSGEGKLYYTLDGTTPNLSSTEYVESILINKNTTLKVIAIKSSSEYSLIESRSYIIGASHNLPIILLTSDNTSRDVRNKEVIDGRVAFNFIEADGTTKLNQYANFKTSGQTSGFTPQLNGKIEADAMHGDDDFDYKMYPDKEIDKFNSFLLRNASQDWGHTHIRDAFVSKLLGKGNLANFPFEAYRPAVLYVNAKYQGIINVREDDDSDYIKHNFGLKKSEFVSGGFDQIINYDFTTDRDELDKILNFNDHVNVHFLIRFLQLSEWGFKTWEDLSFKTPHQYHYNMHDYDATLGYEPDKSVLLTAPMNVSYIIPNEFNTYEPYKNEALQFIAASINHIYNKERALVLLNELTEEIESEIPAHAIISNQLTLEQSFFEKPFDNLMEWKENIEILKSNIETRLDANIFERIQSEYALENPISITYKSSDITNGYVRVQGVKSVFETFTGKYFKNIPLKFKAEPLPGYRFVRWEGDFNSINSEITPVFSKVSSITAVFEPVAISTNNLVINEVQPKNDLTIEDEFGEFNDWIEVYNPNDFAINLAGYYISDSPSNPLKWKISGSDLIKTTIDSKGFLLLWADNDIEQGPNHLGFKLNTSDEVILTSQDAVTKIQEVSFSVGADSSFGALTDGSAEYIMFNKPTPGKTNNAITLIDDQRDENLVSSISLHPNPTSDHIEIYNSKADNLNWILINSYGQMIDSGSSLIIDLNNLRSGIYFLNIDSKTLRIIKN